LNIPVKHGELWVEELDDGRFAINLDDPGDPKFTCVGVQVVDEDLEEETIKTKDVKLIIGDIQDMGRARFVRIRKGGLRKSRKGRESKEMRIRGRKNSTH